MSTATNKTKSTDRLASLRLGWRKWCNMRALSQCTNDDQRAGWNLAADANERGGTRPSWAEATGLGVSDLPAALWVDIGGRIACQEHVGHYAKCELDREPTASVISTPITNWSVVKTRETWMRCESCASEAAWAAKARA